MTTNWNQNVMVDKFLSFYRKFYDQLLVKQLAIPRPKCNARTHVLSIDKLQTALLPDTLLRSRCIGSGM